MKNIYTPYNIDIPFTFSWLNLNFFVNLYFLLHFLFMPTLFIQRHVTFASATLIYLSHFRGFFFVNFIFFVTFFICAQLYLFKARLHLQDRMYVHIRCSTSSQIISWATHQDLVTNMPCVNLVTLLHIKHL